MKAMTTEKGVVGLESPQCMAIAQASKSNVGFLYSPAFFIAAEGGNPFLRDTVFFFVDYSSPACI